MEADSTVFKSVKNIDASSIKRLADESIIFGHQSVGVNILDGINDVMQSNTEIKLNIVDMSKSEEAPTPAFLHFRVGKNGDPKSKCDHFVQIVEQKIKNNVDIVFFKFCFVDVTASTNVAEVFSYYREKMGYLKKKYPRVNIIHVTVPLTTVQTGWKVPVKRLFGKPIDGYDDNAKRNAFNDLLRTEYLGKQPIFDLASIESTYASGSRKRFEMKEKYYFSMVPEYTEDGGHLNNKSRRIVAEQLLILLAELSSR